MSGMTGMLQTVCGCKVDMLGKEVEFHADQS